MDEIEVAKKYGLFIRRASLYEEGAEIDSSYLYSCMNYREPFIEIAAKLEQINDYCFHQLVAAEKQFAGSLKDYVEAENSVYSDPASVDVFAEDLDFSNENLRSVALATPVILGASFLEWALKKIYREVMGTAPPRKKRGKNTANLSDVEHLLELLKNDCGLEFEGARAAPPALESVRNIRNQYVHGEWGKLGNALEKLSLRQFFGDVSEVLRIIDNAYDQKASRCNV